jgi:hypothetical protein
MLFDKLNEVLNANYSMSEYKEGKYEFIMEATNLEFITFELKRFSDIKLAIGGDWAKELKMVFMADPKIVQLDKFRHQGYRDVFRRRFGLQLSLSKQIPNDEDKTNTPHILASRVLYHLAEWKIEELGIIEFLEKYVNGKGNGNVEQ